MYRSCIRGATMKNPKIAMNDANISRVGVRPRHKIHATNPYSGNSRLMPSQKNGIPASVSESELRSPPISAIKLNALTEVSW